MVAVCWPGTMTAACPVVRSFEAVGVQDVLVGAAAGAVFGVADVVGAAGADPGAFGAGEVGDQLRGLGDALAVGDHGGGVAEDVFEQLLVGDGERGDLLGAEQQREAGGAAALKEPCDLGGAERAELVEHDEGRDRRVLAFGGERDEVADQGGGEHLPRQRPAVGFELEVGDAAGGDDVGEVDDGHVLAQGDPRAEVGFGEDREPVARARELLDLGGAHASRGSAAGSRRGRSSCARAARGPAAGKCLTIVARSSGRPAPRTASMTQRR